MDLRTILLIAAAIAPAVARPGSPPAAGAADTVVAPAVAVGGVAAATPASGGLVEPDVTGDGATDDALQDEAEFVFDLETLALLDALLLDPVDLSAGDADRLNILPWLDDAALESLATSPPPRDLAELSRLPGWDASLARRVAPFVRFAPVRAASPARAVVTGSTSALRGRIESQHASLAVRYSDAVEPIVRGFVHAHRKGLALAAGDLRYGHAQGLLAWTGETSARAGGAIARRARGLVGSESASPLRTARGAGFELRVGGTGLAYLSGVGDRTRTALATCRRRITPTSEVALAVLQEGPGIWWSGAATLGPETRRLAFEVAGGHRLAVAASGEARTERLRLGVRFDAIPPGVLPSLAGVTASVRERGARTARAAATYTTRSLAVEAGVAGERRGEGEGRVRWRTETTLAVRARRDRNGIEVRFDDRVTETDTWLGEAESEMAVDASRVVLVRFDHRPRSSWKWTAEMRATFESEPAPARSGRSWSMRFERTRGAFRPVVVGGTFRTDPGVSVGTLGAGSGLGPVRLRGDGMHLSVGLRSTGSHWTAAGGAVTRWTADGPVQVTARGSLSLRFP